MDPLDRLIQDLIRFGELITDDTAEYDVETFEFLD